MKQGLTDITIVLDRSGSMDSVRADTIGGFNAFLAEQKAVPGEAFFSLVQFDDNYEVVHAAAALATIPDLTTATFVPRGSTALLDAIGKTIVNIGERLVRLAEAERPEKVLLVIMTDGQENASKEYSVEQVFKMITEQRESYSWQVVFIGANQDAIKTGAIYGVPTTNSVNYASTGAGTRSVMKNLGASTANYRRSSGAPTENFFDPKSKR